MSLHIQWLYGLAFVIALACAALAWPFWSGVSVWWQAGAVIILLLLCMACIQALARGGHDASRRHVLEKLNQQALDVEVKNASMMSAFTRVIKFSRQQTHTLDWMQNRVDSLLQSIRTVTESADITRDEADTVHDLADKGDHQLQQTNERIDSLAQSARSLDSQFRDVMQHIEDIDDILGMIQDVAKQTNLLSLNASVEAARAGEHGRGFAVVAEEVHKLAARSDEATMQIRTIMEKITGSTHAADGYLKTVLEDVGTSVEHTRQTVTVLSDIDTRSRRTLDAANDMTAAARTQQELGREFADNVATLLTANEQSVDWVGQSNDSLRLVQELAGQLKMQTADLLPNRRGVDVIADCLEEYRACNILIMNADTYDDVKPVIARLKHLDQQIDMACRHYQNSRLPRHFAQALQQFVSTLNSYRGIRAGILDLARSERFEDLRHLVHNSSKPAFIQLKDKLARLVDSADRKTRA